MLNQEIFVSDILGRVGEYCSHEDLLSTDNLVVGVSGGPDSMALLSILVELCKNAPNNKPNIFAVHINHGIRVGDADADQKLVEDYCRLIDVPCITFAYDIPSLASSQGKSLEEMGRVMRYKAFDEFAQNTFGENYEKCSRVAVAHHRGDVSETMLMNLFRGTGLDGLVSPRSANGRVIRPLLCLSKDEIISYLKARNISYAIDCTNAEVDCTRNIWRNEIIPKIGEVSVKAPESALLSTYSLLKTDLDYIEMHVDELYSQTLMTSKARVLSCEIIRNSHKAISSRLIRRLRRDSIGHLVDFTEVHLDSVLEMVNNSSYETRTLNMPFETKAFVCGGFLGFCKDEEQLIDISCGIAGNKGVIAVKDDIHLDFNSDTELTTKIPNSAIQISTQIIENIDSLAYNDKSWFIPLYEGKTTNIIVANGLADVRFCRAGSKSSKELGRMMSDMHIPRLARSRVLGIFCGEKYLWIPGIGHTDGFVNTVSMEAWRRNNPVAPKYLRIDITGG